MHKTAKWLQNERTATNKVKIMATGSITPEETSNAIKNIASWKAPEPDSIQNYWYKVFRSAHGQLTRCYNKILEQPEEMPEFITTGITYLLSKTEQYTEDQSK